MAAKRTTLGIENIPIQPHRGLHHKYGVAYNEDCLRDDATHCGVDAISPENPG